MGWRVESEICQPVNYSHRELLIKNNGKSKIYEILTIIFNEQI